MFAMSLTVSVDTGGTFTDVVVSEAGVLIARLKVPSTPLDPSKAIVSALAKIFGDTDHSAAFELKHGTTVGTNAVLTYSGSEIVLITNRGLTDILAIGRQNRPQLYALHPQRTKPLIDSSQIIGIKVRRTPTGEIIDSLETLHDWYDTHEIPLANADAIAVCLVNDYRDGLDEARIAEYLAEKLKDTFITQSHEITSTAREFERTSTTVANAYIAPIMANYLTRLSDRLHQADLPVTRVSVMGSAGSLISLEQAKQAPVQTVLSGPAGGARGAWLAGLRNGCNAILSLDMGGTSTDVAAIVSDLIPIDEGRIGPHPVRIPVLPIETIGAGGGSIAYIDAGGALRVGPESAGAVPGPACYGRGGQRPTVTDANLVLGRIKSLIGGQFELDSEAAASSLKPLARALGVEIIECARMVLEVVEANMTRACKSLLAERGVDSTAVSLVAFGGAAGLHACAIADALGCREVIFPDDAGLLSARGIDSADNYRSTTRPVYTDLSHADETLVGRILNDALASMDFSYISHSQVFADLRYRGQTFTLPIECTPATSVAALEHAFKREHRNRYGYIFEARPIEWVQTRAFVWNNARAPRPEQESVVLVHRGPETIRQYSATVFVPEGWHYGRNDSGDIIARQDKRSSAAQTMQDHAVPIDVVRQRLLTIAEDMGATLKRAAFSANIKERQDYSCAIFDQHGQLLCHAAHIPVHLGSTPLSVRAAIEQVEFKPGVSAIMNDPYHGGTHLPDVTIVTPIYLEDHEAPAFYVANRAHHADVGGAVPGSMIPLIDINGKIRNLTVDDEGIRLAPQILSNTVRTQFAQASRTPDERYGDLRAQEAANQVGSAGIVRWAERVGSTTVTELSYRLLDYSERLMRDVISKLSDGTYDYLDHLDDDGGAVADIPIPVRMSVSGSEVTLDFSAAPLAVRGPLNAVPAIVQSACFYCFRCLGGENIPANEGLMRPISIITRPGSILEPFEPAPVAIGNVETSQRLVDVIFGVLDKAGATGIPADSAGTMNNVLFGGTDNQQTPPRQFVHYETIGGGAGASCQGPGADGIQLHMTNTLNTPIETLEREFPVTVREYAMAESTPSNNGEQPGGRGLIRHYQFHEDVMVTVMAERRKQKPKGRNGASDGRYGVDEWSPDGVTWHPINSKASIRLKAGQHLRVVTPSGGAWRPPITHP